MAETRQLITNFIQSIESHPNGEQLIEIVEKIIAADYVNINPVLLNSLCQYSGNNLDFLIEFCFLRAAILNEEGRKNEVLQVILEALSYGSNDLKVWYRIVEICLREGALLYAIFFLQEAKIRQINLFDEFPEFFQQLEQQLKLPIGLIHSEPSNNNREQFHPPKEEISPDIKNEAVEVSSKIFKISDNIRDLWESAIGFYSDGCNLKGSSHLSPFIHYAHSTIKAILEIGGSFNNDLEQKIAKYGLFEYQAFFLRLNDLRDRVIHQNYLLTLNEAKEIFEQIQNFLIAYTDY